SSRRRHTRFSRDWSSDVCSSDLVHLGGTGDHVLHVVRVTGAVHVRVVAALGLVLHVRDGDGDTALALLRGLVDVLERRERVEVRVLVVQNLGNRRGQRGFTVVDVTDGADVYVRLGPLELGLRHWITPRRTGCLAGQVRCRGYSPRAFATISCETLEGTSA